jgi:hypothetical protein
MMRMEQAYENTDKEIWREVPEDPYTPSIHVTADGKIGMSLGGTVIVRDIRYWHRLASEEFGKTVPIKE